MYAISSSVLYSPTDRRSEPCATSCGSPSASSTWLGSSEPEVQALAGGGGNALAVEQEQQRLALDALEAEVHRSRDTLCALAVEPRVRNGLAL